MSPQLQQQFEEKLTAMPDAESFYLLTTFANMAMARSDPADRSFVHAATLDLFQVRKPSISCVNTSVLYTSFWNFSLQAFILHFKPLPHIFLMSICRI